jgi:hypothetical protein
MVLCINCIPSWVAYTTATAPHFGGLKQHLQTEKSQCLANPSVPLRLADEKSRIYWVWNVGKAEFVIWKEYEDSNKLFFTHFLQIKTIFLIGKIWLNIAICQTLGFFILKMSPLNKHGWGIGKKEGRRGLPIYCSSRTAAFLNTIASWVCDIFT